MAVSVVILLASLAAALLVYFGVLSEPVSHKTIGDKKLFKKEYIKYAVILFIIFAFELTLAVVSKGHKNDIGLFKLWTSFGEEHKIWQYYTTEQYVDYPPVYLYILFFLGKIASGFNVSSDSSVYLLFVKLVPIVCDSILTVFVFKFAKQSLGEKKALALALVLALNPAVIYNSSVWGQCDSFITLLLIIMLFSLYEKKHILGAVAFAVAIMTKPQMIIYAPLIGSVILSDLADNYKEKGISAFKKPVLAFGAFCITILVIPILITKGDYTLLINKIKGALGLYPYATLNASNLYGMFGLNWVKTEEYFLFLPIKTWGFLFITIMSVCIMIVCFKVKKREKIFYLSAFTTASIYTLAHTMHERYLYSVLLVLLIIFILTKDKRIIISYFVFSATLYLTQVMALSTNNTGRFIMLGDKAFVPFIIISCINVMTYAFLVYAGYDMLIKERFYPVFCEKEKTGSKAKKQARRTVYVKVPEKNSQKSSDKSSSITKKDVLIMVAITVIYTFISFYNLGSLNTPETGYMPSSNEESVIFDLGEDANVERIYTHIGWIARRTSDRNVKREISFSFSKDGKTFGEADVLEVKSVFKWEHLNVDEKARYVKLAFDEGNFYINEIAFFGAGEEDKIIVTNVLSDNETAKFLTDEQDRVVYEYSWFDGTYFDEIYHPRTAFEHLTNRYPYENTHPPLGKVIISLGIIIFGMNPFGWRFFGTLSGVLMVPVMYVFGKKMFKSIFWGTILCLLFTFDFMHLSQTRLATIDSFTTFFVMCSYLFMFLFMERSFYDERLSKVLTPLALSGVFFGLASATKWQGIYAGAGLFVIFVIYILKRVLEYLKAKKDNSGKEESIKIIKSFKPLMIKTIFLAGAFFVVIPFIIYFLSYIPAMNTPDTGLGFFFRNQKTMLSYHSNLKSDKPHPYSSAWWSWPFDIRPLYAYGPNREFVGEEFTQKIVSFGNPFIWWLTIPSILTLMALGIKKGFNDKIKVILIGFFSMYLPWMFISRDAFIYHFFPCTVFVVLAIVYLMKFLVDNGKIKKRTVLLYVSSVIILFFAFYPLLMGIKIPLFYANALGWFETWPF